MPQTCSVCKSTRLPEIDGELVSSRRPLRNIAKRFQVSPTALCRHRKGHLPAKLVLAKQHEDTLHAESLLAEMANLKTRLWSGLEQAETDNNPAAFVAFAREIRQALESCFEMSERIAEKAQASAGGQITIEAVYDHAVRAVQKALGITDGVAAERVEGAETTDLSALPDLVDE